MSKIKGFLTLFKKQINLIFTILAELKYFIT